MEAMKESAGKDVIWKGAKSYQHRRAHTPTPVLKSFRGDVDEVVLVEGALGEGPIQEALVKRVQHERGHSYRGRREELVMSTTRRAADRVAVAPFETVQVLCRLIKDCQSSRVMKRE